MGLNMLSSFVILLWVSVAHADEPKFSIMAEEEPAPFEGVLFDPEATAIMMSDKQLSNSECDLEIEFNLDKQATEYHLQLQNAEIKYDALAQENELVIEKKDLEIQTLQDTLKKHSPRNKWLWYAGGVASGAIVTYGAYRAFNEN